MSSEIDRLDQIISEFPHIKRNALIPLLQAVQDEFSYITEEAISRIAVHLGLPTSKVYGLATFYNQFSFSPRGRFHVVLCKGSSCHLAGAGELVGEVSKLLEVGDGETTRDGLFSLEVQSCMGACGQSPVMAVNENYYPKMDVKQVREIIKHYREKADE